MARLHAGRPRRLVVRVQVRAARVRSGLGGLPARAEGPVPCPAAGCQGPPFAFLRTNAQKYSIDPERIAAIGDSAGGNLALMVGLTPASSISKAVGIASNRAASPVWSLISADRPHARLRKQNGVGHAAGVSRRKSETRREPRRQPAQHDTPQARAGAGDPRD